MPIWYHGVGGSDGTLGINCQIFCKELTRLWRVGDEAGFHGADLESSLYTIDNNRSAIDRWELEHRITQHYSEAPSEASHPFARAIQ